MTMPDEERRPWIAPFELDPNKVEFEPEPQEQPPSTELTVAMVETEKRKGRGFWRTLGWLGLGAAIVAILLDTGYRLLGQIESQPLLGIPMAILIGLVVIAALAIFLREVVQLRRLSRRAWLRGEGARLSGSDLHGESQPLLAQVTSGLPATPPIQAARTSFESKDDDVLGDGERLRLYERVVLEPVDRLAYRLVLESSRDIGILTALAPYGLLDGMLVLWRTTIMLRQVARLYGIAPGPAATAALLRRCLRNSAIAGLADVASHALLEQAGASLVTLLSAKAGQGAGNALLSARLGLEAIRECRPLPFVATSPPSLGQLRKAILEGDRTIAPLLPQDEDARSPIRR